MNKLTAYRSGVFTVEAQRIARDLVRRARNDGLFVAFVEGQAVSTKQAFFEETACGLRFPDYFGWNWDAFEESIQDLEWLPAKGSVLVFNHFDRLATAEPREWAIGLDILEESAGAWRRAGKPMLVLLRGPKEAAPTVTEFPPLSKRQQRRRVMPQPTS